MHLFYGSEAPADLDRRTLETFAVAWWADKTHRDKKSYVGDVVPLGDFNLPKAAPGDRIFDALVALGLTTPSHSSQIGSAIASDNQYDQIAFFPGTTMDRFTRRLQRLRLRRRALPGPLGAAHTRRSSAPTRASTSRTTARSGPSSRPPDPLERCRYTGPPRAISSVG